MLPEKRFMFGMRGGSSWGPAAERKRDIIIRREFDRMFPAWSHVEAEHTWSGLLSLSWSYSQYTGQLGDLPDAWTSFAYHGNGVAMGSYAGNLLADMALGDLRQADLPVIMATPPAKFPMAWLRMKYIKGYYAAWDLKEVLRG